MSDDKNKTLAEAADSKWWDFYLIRYAMGTVVGSLLVFFMLHLGMKSTSTETAKIFSDLYKLFGLGGYGLWILPLLGLSYCYLASAPILVIHACRSAFLGVKEKTMFFFIVIPAIFFVLIFNFSSISIPAYAASVLILLAIIVIQLLCIYLSIDNRRGYYKRLCDKRAGATGGSKEYVESYKHLREHGNAFMIVMMEIILTVILYNATSYMCLIAVIIAWISPAAYVWFVGSYLEKNFCEDQKL